MDFYRHKHPEDTFDCVAHEWIAGVGELFFFVMKGSDRPTLFDRLDEFDLVPSAEVPLQVRRKAYARWAAFSKTLDKPHLQG